MERQKYSQDGQSSSKKYSTYSNREEPIDPITTENECEFESNAINFEKIAVTESTLEEVKAANERLKNGKSPGIDSITAELLKACDTEFSRDKFLLLMQKV